MVTQKTADSKKPSPGAQTADNGAPSSPVAQRQSSSFMAGIPAGLLISAVIIALLWISIGGEMLHFWKSDKALSHGPLVPIIAAALLYLKRDELKNWREADGLGLLAL